MRPPACDMIGREDRALIRKIMVFTEDYEDCMFMPPYGVQYRKRYYKLFPYWRIEDGQ